MVCTILEPSICQGAAAWWAWSFDFRAGLITCALQASHTGVRERLSLSLPPSAILPWAHILLGTATVLD